MPSGLLLLGSYVFCRWLTTTKFGLVQRAIRDSETRVLFSGYAAANYKLFVFVFAAVIAGMAARSTSPQVGIINPSEMTPDKSLEAVVWCAVGGRGTLVGPIIGAIGVNALKSWATRAFPDLWLIILGGLFILIVLFMPKGIVGLRGKCQELRKRLKRREPAAAAACRTEQQAQCHRMPNQISSRRRGREQDLRRLQGDHEPQLLPG